MNRSDDDEIGCGKGSVHGFCDEGCRVSRLNFELFGQAIADNHFSHFTRQPAPYQGILQVEDVVLICVGGEEIHPHAVHSTLGAGFAIFIRDIQNAAELDAR